jgi:nitrogen fixation NifU-like protein
MYSKKVMDHYENPRNVGEIKDANGIGKVGNPVCGDIMKIYLKIENNVITDVKFKTFGCGAAIATSSISTELVKGKTVEEALEITNKQVVDGLDGLPPAKMHCSVLAEDAIKDAIADYFRKQGMSEEEVIKKCNLKNTHSLHGHEIGE